MTLPAGPSPPLPAARLSRIEDAGLNASAPPQQRWIDGWLVRFSPGKAKRARCINALADGRLPLAERLAVCEAVFAAATLPLFVRITPFTQPAKLDAWLEQRGFFRIDDTCVMAAAELPQPPEPIPPSLGLHRLSTTDYAEQVGRLRGSSPEQRLAHAQRLAASPVPYQGWALRRREDGQLLACGQMAAEADMVGLYDVFTDPLHRGQGLARQLCGHLLGMARQTGARVAYLQVDASNEAARAVYRRLGFADAYSYHYRTPDAGAR